MTGIHNQFSNINRDKLKILHSELVPGCDNTSVYPDFVADRVADINSRPATGSILALDRLLGNLAQVPQASWIGLIMAFEAAEPALFKALYGELLTAFYSAPETAERVRRLADAGPRAASPHFEPSLLDAVITKQSGKRRL